MFKVTGKKILITAGDTGIVGFRITGITATPKDRGILTIKTEDETEVIVEKVAIPDENIVRFPFVHEDTENWEEGTYTWDVRFITNAKFDSEGKIYTGEQVATPMKPGILEVMKAVGEV